MTNSEEELLRGWLASVSGGDHQALEPLYQATSSRVLGLLLRICGRRELAEECLVDTYAKVWEHASRFRPERGTAFVWIATIARRTAIDRLRRSGAERRIDGDVPDVVPAGQPTPFQASVDSERAREVQLALRDLSVAQRSAIEATFFQGMTHAEAAEALGQPLGTVKSRVRSGLTALRDRLRGGEEGAA